MCDLVYRLVLEGLQVKEEKLEKEREGGFEGKLGLGVQRKES